MPTDKHTPREVRAVMAAREAAEPERVLFFLGWCKKCEICMAFCPRDSLEMGPDGYPWLAHPETCTECGLCEVLCPDFVITVSAYHGRQVGRKVGSKVGGKVPAPAGKGVGPPGDG
ncbi:MAG TPA: 4Fe-4S dicluster domain-containing protein [Dehalococcoidia bacterium]|nr:4Fe-4S dicluster domain-containing protein [Dehalococcoidia bacterium]